MKRTAAAPPSTTTRHTPWLVALALLLALAAVPLLADDEDAPRFKVLEASTRLVAEVYLLDARVEFAFTDEATEALENGVPLTLALEIEVFQARDLVWDASVATLAQRYRVEYRALSERYQVTNLNTGELSSHANLRSALERVGRLRDFPMLDRRLLKVGERYTARLRATLDVDALPLPLRPVAYLSGSWKMNSDWHAWLLSP